MLIKSGGLDLIFLAKTQRNILDRT